MQGTNGSSKHSNSTPEVVQLCSVISEIRHRPPPSIEGKVDSVRAASRRNRVYSFRNFVLTTYGSYLESCQESPQSANVVVLDIAGGKGILSWLLKNDATLGVNIDCVILDPRLANHTSLERSVDYLQRNPDVMAERAETDSPGHQPLAALLNNKELVPKCEQTRPRQICLYVDDHLVQAIRDRIEAESFSLDLVRYSAATQSWKDFVQRSVTRAYQEAQSDPNNILSNNLELNVGAGLLLTDPDDIWETVFRRVSLILGFHPDQATEACLDLALSGILGRKVPFAVVPCCVFPKEFPDRVIRDTGERVLKYDSFLKYLMQKKYKANMHSQIEMKHTNSDEIHTFELPIPKKTARNTVLYTI